MIGIFDKNESLSKLFNNNIARISSDESLAPDYIRNEINEGRMVFLGNSANSLVCPIIVGQPSRVKVNANIGTSALSYDVDMECKKLQASIDAGADTVMDLSVAGELDKIRFGLMKNCTIPFGTVPMYAAMQQIVESGKSPSELDPEIIFAEIEKQAEQGVDFMTIHCGLTKKGAELATDSSRITGIVSRGGAILASWMLENGKENPLLTGFDRILKIANKYNVTLSLGDGLRPGCGSDAGDAAQYEEVMTLGSLAKHALDEGVQCMIEGPGHVRLNDIENQMRTIKRLTNGAPLYILGPLPTDIAAGHDHIAGAIGASLAVRAGADFLCFLTPAEHLTLPDIEDTYEGVIASRIAAQIGEVALGRSHAIKRENDMSKSRVNLDWGKMREAVLDKREFDKRREKYKNEEVCAMCGEYCSMRMMKNSCKK